MQDVFYRRHPTSVYNPLYTGGLQIVYQLRRFGFAAACWRHRAETDPNREGVERRDRNSVHVRDYHARILHGLCDVS